MYVTRYGYVTTHVATNIVNVKWISTIVKQRLQDQCIKNGLVKLMSRQKGKF